MLYTGRTHPAIVTNHALALQDEIENLEKLYVPRCITFEVQDRKIEQVFIRIGSESEKKMIKYLDVSGKVKFFIINVFSVDSFPVPYTIRYNIEKSHKVFNVDKTFLDKKTPDEAVAELDTIEKASIAMDLLCQKLSLPKVVEPPPINPLLEKLHMNMSLRDDTNEKVGEQAVWNHKNIEGKLRLHEDEVDYVKFRMNHAVDPLHAWLAKQLGVEKKSVNVRVPKIALCASGGGLRAAVATRFFVDILQNEGFLPTISYMSTLSGSTWFMTDWLVNKQLLPTEGDPWLVNSRDDLGTSKFASLGIASTLAWHHLRDKAKYGFSSWFIELWANVIGNGYLTLNGVEWIPDNTRFSKILEENLQSEEAMSTYPWPIMTAVGVLENDWFEFTPAQIGRLSIGSPEWCYVEPFAYGCEVDEDGKKIPSPPGDELAQLMATWGSALCFELKDLDKYLVGYSYFGKIWSFLTHQKYPCPSFDCPSWEFHTKRVLLRDAGLGINVPYPPVVEPERGVEIIIALDVSEDCWDKPASTLDQFASWIDVVKHPKFPKGVPQELRAHLQSSDLNSLRKPQIYDLNGVVVVYIPVAIEDASKRVSTFNMKHDHNAQQLIYDTVWSQWEHIKVPLAKYIKDHYPLNPSLVDPPLVPLKSTDSSHGPLFNCFVHMLIVGMIAWFWLKWLLLKLLSIFKGKKD